jgi:hypothetical protein
MTARPWKGIRRAATLAPLCVSACTSSPSSTPTFDAGTLYGLCVSPGTPVATLAMRNDGNVGYTVPIAAGQTEPLSLTLINYGNAPAVQIQDLTPKSPWLSYVGGSYPGTGGTCGTSLAAGQTCALRMTARGPKTKETALVLLQYDDGIAVQVDTHIVSLAPFQGSFKPISRSLPPLMTSHGGRVLDKVHLVTVSFSDTPEVDAILAFGDWVVTSSWWSTVGKDYGVGPGTHEHVTLSDPTPSTLVDAEFAAVIDSEVATGVLPAGPENVYMFFFSSAATVSSIAYSGWHHASPGGNVYAVITSACAPSPSEIQAAYTFVGAHELIEAATDPDPLTGYTFDFDEGEVADVCNQFITVDGRAVPTIWSLSAAAAVDNPCVPSAGDAQINVSAPSQVSLKGSGNSTSVQLTGWSSTRVGDWIVRASVSGDYASSVSATLQTDGTSYINDGESVTLKLATDGTVPAGTRLIVEVTSFGLTWSGNPVALQDSIGVQGAVGFVQIPVTITP